MPCHSQMPTQQQGCAFEGFASMLACMHSQEAARLASAAVRQAEGVERDPSGVQCQQACNRPHDGIVIKYAVEICSTRLEDGK